MAQSDAGCCASIVERRSWNSPSSCSLPSSPLLLPALSSRRSKHKSPCRPSVPPLVPSPSLPSRLSAPSRFNPVSLLCPFPPLVSLPVTDPCSLSVPSLRLLTPSQLLIVPPLPLLPLPSPPRHSPPSLPPSSSLAILVAQQFGSLTRPPSRTTTSTPATPTSSPTLRTSLSSRGG